jgi:hypothetical protein
VTVWWPTSNAAAAVLAEICDPPDQPRNPCWHGDCYDHEAWDDLLRSEVDPKALVNLARHLSERMGWPMTDARARAKEALQDGWTLR